MAPLVRRTWAPRGETPILRQRTRSRQKVSAAGVVTISPQRRRLGLYVALYPNANITAAVLVGFLRALRRHVRGPLILIWDRLATHRAHSMKAFLDHCPQLRTVLLPPYAPELNAVEYVWGYLKGGRWRITRPTTRSSWRAPPYATPGPSLGSNTFCEASSMPLVFLYASDRPLVMQWSIVVERRGCSRGAPMRAVPKSTVPIMAT
jgi:hypothetical protein